MVVLGGGLFFMSEVTPARCEDLYTGLNNEVNEEEEVRVKKNWEIYSVTTPRGLPFGHAQ